MNGKPVFYVEKTGLHTSFQDLGRFGYQQYGVVTSGAMDDFSLQVANMLVGNKRGEAALEFTMVGPKLIALTSSLIAIGGADLSAKINGKPIPTWETLLLHEGDELSFGQPKSGMRSYLAIAGGFAIPKIMGSKSFYERASLGQKVKNGEVLHGFPRAESGRKGLLKPWIPSFSVEEEIRVVIGPHEKYFHGREVQKFLEQIYIVDTKSDRMGYQLKGQSIRHRNGADIWSTAVSIGGIQIPANGQPIILLADRQTTGGYTIIATVVSVDLTKVAQLPPGGKIKFKSVSVEQAQTLYRERERLLKKIQLSRDVES